MPTFLIVAFLLNSLLPANAPQDSLFKASARPADTRTPTVKVALRFDLRLMRIEVADDGQETNPATVATPRLAMLDGTTATIAVTGGEPSYTIALSPALEKVRNTANTNSNSASTPTPTVVQLLWSLRLAGKGLPSATGVAVTGSTRATVGETATLAEVVLRDSKTGKATLFRLTAKPIIDDNKSAAPEPTPAGGTVKNAPGGFGNKGRVRFRAGQKVQVKGNALVPLVDPTVQMYTV